MANIEKIVLPDNTEYDIKDKGALQITDLTDGKMESNGWNCLKVKATDSTHNPHLDLYDSTDKPVGTMWVQQSSGDFRIYGYQSNGTDTSSGIYMEQGGKLIAFGRNNDIVLRPNGVATTTGQVTLDTTGQLRGGHALVSNSGSTSTTCTTSGTNLGTLTINAPCLVMWSVRTSTIGQAQQIRFTVGGTSQDIYVPSSSSSRYYSGMCFVTSNNPTLTVQPLSANITVGHWSMYAFGF